MRQLHTEVSVRGWPIRVARLRDEYFDHPSDISQTIATLQQIQTSADLFTFVQEISDRVPRYDYKMELDPLSVLSIESYDTWWRSTLNDKTRNMIRKAEKTGIWTAIVPFTDDLIRGIEELYRESPTRQGKPFLHYGMDFDTIKRTHGTFLDRSDFIGAYLGSALVGFAKLTRGHDVASLMQVLSMIRLRDKAPTNALIAKAVEVCVQREIPHLHYGIWTRRGGGLMRFKSHHGFRRFDVPRFFVPLTIRGRLALKLNLHRDLRRYVPVQVLDILAGIRSKITAVRTKHGSFTKHGAVAQRQSAAVHRGDESSSLSCSNPKFAIGTAEKSAPEG